MFIALQQVFTRAMQILVMQATATPTGSITIISRFLLLGPFAVSWIYLKDIVSNGKHQGAHLKKTYMDLMYSAANSILLLPPWDAVFGGQTISDEQMFFYTWLWSFAVFQLLLRPTSYLLGTFSGSGRLQTVFTFHMMLLTAKECAQHRDDEDLKQQFVNERKFDPAIIIGWSLQNEAEVKKHNLQELVTVAQQTTSKKEFLELLCDHLVAREKDVTVVPVPIPVREDVREPLLSTHRDLPTYAVHAHTL